MANSLIEFQIGSIQFKAEGTAEWVESQAEVFIEKIENLSTEIYGNFAAKNDLQETTRSQSTQDAQISSLKKHLEERGASKNQNDRFLATADWLRRRGQKGLQTGDVTKALRENHQSRLGNASECLNQNISKGYCEKNGKEFFITQEGLEHLGYT